MYFDHQLLQVSRRRSLQSHPDGRCTVIPRFSLHCEDVKVHEGSLCRHPSVNLYIEAVIPGTASTQKQMAVQARFPLKVNSLAYSHPTHHPSCASIFTQGTDEILQTPLPLPFTLPSQLLTARRPRESVDGFSSYPTPSEHSEVQGPRLMSPQNAAVRHWSCV